MYTPPIPAKTAAIFPAFVIQNSVLSDQSYTNFTENAIGPHVAHRKLFMMFADDARSITYHRILYNLSLDLHSIKFSVDVDLLASIFVY